MRARLLFAAVFGLLCLPLFLLPADRDRLEAQALQTLLLDAGGKQWDGSGALELSWPGEPSALRADALRAGLRLPLTADGEVDRLQEAPGLPGYRVAPADAPSAEATRLSVTTGDGLLRLVGADGEVAKVELGDRAALLPPLVAILLAFLTRRTLLSLGIGIALGTFLVTGFAPTAFLQLLFADILWARILSDPFHLHILGFVILLSASVAVITRMGGIDGMVLRLVVFARSRRSVQFVAYALGLGIFFDDYANTIVVGNSCGPLFDRQKVSRAKLAYIVDSTAAPVAGIAVLSTWVAYQISTFAPQLPTVGLEESQGYTLFLQTIPYRFYCIFAILTVGFVIWHQRDFGPMRRAEEAARRGDGSGADGALHDEHRVAAKPGVAVRARNGVLPLATMILGTAFLIYWYGAIAVRAAAAKGDASAAASIAAGGLEWLRAVLGASDSTKAIFHGSLAALVLAGMLAMGQRLLSPREVAGTAGSGVRTLFRDAVLVLVFAWAIGKVCTDVGTANYLVAVAQDLMEARWLPLILFVTACFVAFATGSSWTTMAILQPNVVLLAWQLGEQSDIGGLGLLVLSIGAVLEGAIFGDHCSPISDTTVLSSTASRCRHIEHVRTQAPYALMTAAVAIGVGYLGVALFGLDWPLLLPLGGMMLFLLVRFLGRPTAPAVSGEERLA
jgi:Na+/H+ antiporter NhaC